MAKRFIDTGLFDDEWFMNLSHEGKLLWIYFITKCDHAGILKLNLKLCKVQTDIESIETVIHELGDRLVTLGEQLYFIPKFIEFQYPGFPKSKAPQQQLVVKILEKHGLFNNGMVSHSKVLAISDKTLPKELTNSYGNDNGIGIGNGNEQEKVVVNIDFDVFWDMYDKKVGDKTKLIKKWNNLTDSDRQTIIDYIPKYIKSRPDKQFRKNPETFFNNKSWADEIISNLNKGIDRGQHPGQIIVDGSVPASFKK